MTPYVNTRAVSRHNSEAKTLDTTTYRIGKWRINLEGFIDYYGTYNYRFGVNGGTPTYDGEIYWSEDTNGVGYRNHLKKADAFLDKMRTDHPLHGPPNINPYGYLIPLDGQPKDCIGTHVSDPGDFARNRVTSHHPAQDFMFNDAVTSHDPDPYDEHGVNTKNSFNTPPHDTTSH